MQPAHLLAQRWIDADPGLRRTNQVIRDTFDQTYDGQRTGRYRWDQLHKTEKTHFGTLIEINLRRAFADIINDGQTLDFLMDGIEVDCKFSQSMGGWMIPPEALDHHLLVITANDEHGSWSLGFVRADQSLLSMGTNGDRKRTITAAGRERIVWVAHNQPLLPNALLQAPEADVHEIMSQPSGQQKINMLFRRLQGIPISRVVVATVAQQADYMKRVRDNGGARQHLRAEGILIFGHWRSHAALLQQLGFTPLDDGYSMSLHVTPCRPEEPRAIELDGRYWCVAPQGSLAQEPAPLLPGR